MNMNKICVVCGEEFLATRSDKKYCSAKCRSAESNRKAAEKNGNFNNFKGKVFPKNKACNWCGNVFAPTHNRQTYCSADCAKEMYKARIYKTERVLVCECCEKEFTAMRKRTYCSNECRYEANGRKRKQKPKSKKTKPKYTLAQVNALARSEGLSYGQYMAKYNL